jgi:hypothetical protein
MRPRPARAACRRSRPLDVVAEPADRGRTPQYVDQTVPDYSPSPAILRHLSTTVAETDNAER